MQDPKDHHLKAIKQVIRYIKGTKEHGIIYKKEGGCKITESPLPGDTQKQQLVALSCESEFMAATEALCQALWLKRLLSELTMLVGWQEWKIERIGGGGLRRGVERGSFLGLRKRGGEGWGYWSLGGVEEEDGSGWKSVRISREVGKGEGGRDEGEGGEVEKVVLHGVGAKKKKGEGKKSRDKVEDRGRKPSVAERRSKRKGDEGKKNNGWRSKLSAIALVQETQFLMEEAST
ncbi:hypothetical protein Tco_1145340 [Tanacetum coccineum]